VKKFIYLIFILVSLKLNSQQQAQYTHYIFNHFAINPAVAGSKDCLDATFGYRNQWVGFEGAPKTAFGSIHATIGQNKFGSPKKHAIGALIETDRYGPFSRAKLKLAYAYHFPLNRKVFMSAGLFVGVEQLSFRSGEVTLINFNDPAIGQASSAVIVPEISPGIFLQNQKWFAGASITQLISNEVKAIGTSESKLVRHGNLMVGMSLDNKKWIYTPSALLKIAPAAPFAIDLNIMAEYNRTFAFGVTYRNVDAVAALIKFDFLDNFTLGYAFDYTLSKIQNAASNSHEIILSINPCGNRKGKSQYSCPTFN